MSKPIAVLISDIHFSVNTLEVASNALVQARNKAYDLGVPLILAGDTLDSKAIIRGECANRLIDILSEPKTETFVIVGNHDLISEKGKEHSLNFIKPYCNVVQSPVYIPSVKSTLAPYFNNIEEVQAFLDSQKSGSRLIMHQGVQTAFMGHYVQDKTSLLPQAFKDFRVISGHYHRAQDIKCGRPKAGGVGLFSYIGTPYTTSFAEANDGPKGFQILHENGLLTPVSTNLRKHEILEFDLCDIDSHAIHVGKDDLIWLKLRGTSTELEKLKKHEIGEKLFGHCNFKLDKIYTDVARLEEKTSHMTENEILDALIDNSDDTEEQKAFLKNLWREVVKCDF